MDEQNGIFADEQGSMSAGRVFLAVWLAQAIGYIYICLILRIATESPVLAIDTAVATALIAWCAGARIAQYVGPQIGAATTAVGSALRAVVSKRRDPEGGTESTP